jgi:hypothetical protein
VAVAVGLHYLTWSTIGCVALLVNGINAKPSKYSLLQYQQLWTKINSRNKKCWVLRLGYEPLSSRWRWTEAEQSQRDANVQTVNGLAMNEEVLKVRIPLSHTRTVATVYLSLFYAA